MLDDIAEQESMSEPSAGTDASVDFYYEQEDGNTAQCLLFELPGLVAAGTVTELTSVWMNGLDGWMILDDARVCSSLIAETLRDDDSTEAVPITDDDDVEAALEGVDFSPALNATTAWASHYDSVADDILATAPGESLGDMLMDTVDDEVDSPVAKEAAARMQAKEKQRATSEREADLAAWRCGWCQCELTDAVSQAAGPDGEGTLCEMCGEKFATQEAKAAEKEKALLVETERLALQKKEQDAAAAAAATASRAKQAEALAALQAKLAADLANISVDFDEDSDDSAAVAQSALVPEATGAQAHEQEDAAGTEGGHTGESGAPVSIGAIALVMPVEDWLGMYGAGNCAPNFRAEDIETLEDVAFVVQAEEDLAELGVSAEQVRRLWPTVVAAQNGSLSTVETAAVDGAVDADPFATLSAALEQTAPQTEQEQEQGQQMDDDADPFAALQAELSAGLPSSLF